MRLGDGSMEETKMPPMVPGGGPKAELAAEYTFDILAPAGVPQKYLHIDLDARTAVLDTEHGRQTVRDFTYEKEIIRFQAMLGSGGDELFTVVAKLYGGGVALGEASMVGDNMPKSPVVLRQV